MDIGNVKPVVTGVTAPVPRAPGASEQAARTELPPPAAVGKAETSERAPGAGRERTQQSVSVGPRPTSGEFVRDLETKDLVFRWIDVESGEVVRQLPDEAVLRVRAMIEAWTGTPQGRTAVYDITA